MHAFVYMEYSNDIDLHKNTLRDRGISYLGIIVTKNFCLSFEVFTVIINCCDLTLN